MYSSRLEAVDKFYNNPMEVEWIRHKLKTNGGDLERTVQKVSNSIMMQKCLYWPATSLWQEIFARIKFLRRKKSAKFNPQK